MRHVSVASIKFNAGARRLPFDYFPRRPTGFGYSILCSRSNHRMRFFLGIGGPEMAERRSVGRVAVHTLLGGAAGALISLLSLPILDKFASYYPREDGFGLLLLVIAVGVAAGAILGMTVGGVTLRGVALYAAIGFVAGTLVGLGAGMLFGFVVAALQGDSMMWGKIEAAARAFGVIVGAPSGAVLGLVIGTAVGVFHRKRQRVV
jgi:hypothetical protein